MNTWAVRITGFISSRVLGEKRFPAKGPGSLAGLTRGTPDVCGIDGIITGKGNPKNCLYKDVQQGLFVNRKTDAEHGRWD
jgi:hypothetical protein